MTYKLKGAANPSDYRPFYTRRQLAPESCRATKEQFSSFLFFSPFIRCLNPPGHRPGHGPAKTDIPFHPSQGKTLCGEVGSGGGLGWYGGWQIPRMVDDSEGNEVRCENDGW